MAENSLFSFHSTVLFVQDVEISKKFYTEVMGEEIELDLGKNIGFKSALAIWDGNYGRNVIFGDENAGDGDFSSKRMIELYYETEDMEKTFENLNTAGVEFVHGVTAQPWCQLTVRFLDPDGHMIEVGERMDVCVKRLASSGMSADEIATSTTMPPEIVKYMLEMDER
ncbi:VOC family protein [Methanogenium marinum]|uniref:VOC family protein n=1 Tax=Methanogenium marinum TaxID=348610 RepID=A0A9Q4KTB4_9EURY|nr:VOC family protein [Methanogenium marinum]MDE4908417.1 VOC family protein [Methanogenium marinum]